MARKVDRYSRLVLWLKVAFPIVALGILSTVFLVSQRGDPQDGLPYSDRNIAELAREEQIGAPSYRGVTGSGTAVSVIAATARPDPDSSGVLVAEEVTALLETDDGAVTQISARRGRIDPDGGSAVLTGDVRVATSQGVRVATDRLEIGLGDASVESPGAMEATAPMGEIDAGAMRLDARGGNATTPLVFNRGVSLTYTP